MQTISSRLQSSKCVIEDGIVNQILVNVSCFEVMQKDTVNLSEVTLLVHRDTDYANKKLV